MLVSVVAVIIKILFVLKVTTLDFIAIYFTVEIVHSFESHQAGVNSVVVASRFLTWNYSIQLHRHSKAEIPDVRGGEQGFLIVFIVNGGGDREIPGGLVVAVESGVG